MRKFKAILIGFLSVLMFATLTQVSAAGENSNTGMRSVSGEITMIDVKLGKLQLRSDPGQDTRGITEYRINQNDTRVTDPTDKKFLVIKDLRVGQHVTIELSDNTYAETLAQKIIAEPMPEPTYQEATGELQAIDVQAGTLVIEQKPLPDEEKGGLSYFVFEPNNIVVIKNQNAQPVESELMPGDTVRVEYIVKDGRRQARSITLLKAARETTRTTTTTTTSKTVTR